MMACTFSEVYAGLGTHGLETSANVLCRWAPSKLRKLDPKYSSPGKGIRLGKVSKR